MNKEERIEEAYGEFYLDNRDIIDDNGWLRVCQRTSVKMSKHLYHNQTDFDSRVETLTDAFKTYARPKILNNL